MVSQWDASSPVLSCAWNLWLFVHVGGENMYLSLCITSPLMVIYPWKGTLLVQAELPSSSAVATRAKPTRWTCTSFKTGEVVIWQTKTVELTKTHGGCMGFNHQTRFNNGVFTNRKWSDSTNNNANSNKKNSHQENEDLINKMMISSTTVGIKIIWTKTWMMPISSSESSTHQAWDHPVTPKCCRPYSAGKASACPKTSNKHPICPKIHHLPRNWVKFRWIG